MKWNINNKETDNILEEDITDADLLSYLVGGNDYKAASHNETFPGSPSSSSSSSSRSSYYDDMYSMSGGTPPTLKSHKRAINVSTPKNDGMLECWEPGEIIDPQAELNITSHPFQSQDYSKLRPSNKAKRSLEVII